MNKKIKAYQKIYRKALVKAGVKDIDAKADVYAVRLSEMYVEMFETYGIRGLCKIFCNTDTRAYSGLKRHVEFIRHSDLSDGLSCHDEVIRIASRST